MANTKSAAKNARKSLRLRDANREVKEGIKKVEKELRNAVASKRLDVAKDLLPKVASAYDKAAKKNTIHPNKARRKNSRLASLIAKASAPAVAPSV